MPQEIESPKNKERPIFLKTLSLAWEMGYTIAGPLVVLAFLGRFLDKKYESSPVALLSGVFLAMIISGAVVFKKTKKIMEDANKQ
ncbi:MAG: AtpZ/AtpI family protein [bacterium]|nr:AtpZ/AtpI family protein [bacterium]